MSDTNGIPLTDFFNAPSSLTEAPAGTPAGTKPVDQDEMTLAINYGNLMKSKGISDANVETFLKRVGHVPETGGSSKSQGVPLKDFFADVRPPDFGDVKSGSNTRRVDPSYASQVGQRFKQYGEDISNIGGEAYSYVKNYTAEHETHEPGPVTDEEMKAAQQMGIPQFNIGSGGFYHVDGKAVHPTIYKMTPDERQALNDRTLAHIGLDAKGERARAEAFSQAKFDENADPIANITSKNILSGLVEDMLNPKLATSKQYAAIQQMVTANKIMKNPLAHSQEEVDAAINLKDYYKATSGKSPLENAQDILQEAKENPGSTMAKFLTQLEADPELGFLGKARLGTLLTEAKLASLSADLKKAQATVDFAARTGIKVTSKLSPEAITSEMKDLTRKQILGNMASEPLIGAAANVALDQAAQMKEKGYVTPGSGATPAAIGAALGTVAAAGEATRLLPGKSNRGPAPPGDAGGDSKRPGGPGEPLPPETPINDKSHVPYAGGVDAITDIIHYDKSMPKALPMNNMRGEEIKVPVQDLVAYHEAVEKPLMNLKGPMGSDALLELLKRIQGEGTIPKEVMNKLKKGTSLTYPEAHDIATLAENARVRALYGVRPEVYQGALKPYIEQVAKNNKTALAESIPPTLDKKPYEDMGGEESLKGQGANYEDKTKRDALIRGIKFGSRAITGAAVGAGVGAALSPDDREQGAKEGVFLPLLSRVFSHGDSPLHTPIMRGERLVGKITGSPEAQALNAKLDNLVTQGVSPKDIWSKHGFYQDAQDNWHYEISDKDITFKGPKFPSGVSMPGFHAPGTIIPLNQFINHPEFAKVYPELWKDLRIKFEDNIPPTDASFDPVTNIIHAHPNIAKDVLVHEMQHAVQEYEGLPQGTNPSAIFKDLKLERGTAEANFKMFQDAMNQYKKLGREAPIDLQERYRKAFEKMEQYPKTDSGLHDLAFQKYRNAIGEVQASASEGRTQLTPEMRRKMYPGERMPSSEKQWDANTPGQVMGHVQETEHEPPRRLSLTKEQQAKLEGERAQRELTAANLPKNTDLQHEPQIIQGVREGNPFYTQLLYNHYMPRLVKSMDRWMRDAGPRLAMSGEDIAQEAFLKATQNIGEFKGDSSFYTWLYSIAKNEAKNAGKKAERTPETESMTKPPAEEKTGFFGEPTVEEPSTEAEKSVTTAPSRVPTPEQHVAVQQIQEVVQRTISTLPKHHAEVLRLFEIEGKSILEIARDLDRPVGTVLSQAMRGRQALRAAFMGTEMEKLFSKLPPNQRGFADVDFLKRLAKFAVLAGGGAALGANYFDPQHPYKAMVQGAVLGLMSGQVKWRDLYGKFKSGFQAGPDMMAKDALNTYDHALARGDQLTATTRYAIDGLVKTPESRVRVAQWVDGDKSISLTPEEQKAAKIYQDMKDNMDKETLRSGTTAGFLYDLIHNMWEDTPERDKALAAVKNAFTKKAGQAPISLMDQMKLIRQLTDLSKGKSLGLKPVVEDANDLAGHYIGAQTRSLANRSLVESLKNFTVPGTNFQLIMGAGKAPNTYVPLRATQLSRYKAHPSIAPSLEFLHDVQGHGFALAIESANMAIKRTNVGFSFFHATALINAAIGGMEMTHPIRNLVDIAQSSVGKSRGHEAYLGMQPGDNMDYLIRALKITPRKGALSVEDVKTGFYEGLKVVQDALDEAIPGMGKQTVGRVGQLSKGMDHLLWENLHSGLKLTVSMNALERIQRSYAKDVAKNPMAPVPTLAEMADRASMFTNDIFGGLNWRRLADESTSKWGRGLAYMLANPSGRRIAQVLLFAPDWTYSTVRSIAQAMPGKGSGLKGLLNPKELGDLHRLYIIRSALLYATLYNGINFAMSGHMMWENERHGKPEPFMVDLGNGEWMQANKHAMEVPNLLANPSKWLLGKLGVIPSEALDQLLHKEYLNPDYSPEMKGSRLSHALKRVAPFNISSLAEQGPRQAIMSTLGFPVTGKPTETSALTPPMKQKDWEHVQELQEKKRERQRKRTELLLGGGK